MEQKETHQFSGSLKERHPPILICSALRQKPHRGDLAGWVMQLLAGSRIIEVDQRPRHALARSNPALNAGRAGYMGRGEKHPFVNLCPKGSFEDEAEGCVSFF